MVCLRKTIKTELDSMENRILADTFKKYTENNWEIGLELLEILKINLKENSTILIMMFGNYFPSQPHLTKTLSTLT